MLVFSNTPEEKQTHLHYALSLLRVNRLVVRTDKCVFAALCIDFIGHRLTPEEILPLPDKVSDMINYPTLTTIK